MSPKELLLFIIIISPSALTLVNFEINNKPYQQLYLMTEKSSESKPCSQHCSFPDVGDSLFLEYDAEPDRDFDHNTVKSSRLVL
jgi:hypothetical protein